MQSYQCLFYLEKSECNEFARDEHIIQAGLAGSLSSPNIICENCNNYFSHKIDTELIKFYQPIIKILDNFLSGRSKHKKKKSKLISEEEEQCDIEYVGGSAKLAKINKSYSSNGQLERIVAPASIAPQILENIAKSEGVKSTTIKKMLITEHFTNARENVCLSVTPFLMRAVLLDILELADHVSFAHNLPNIAKHHYLSDLRLWVRTGRSSKHFPLKSIFYSFAPVSDLLDSLFEPSTFSHRLVICFDHDSKVLILIAQFVNTMPWVFVLENIVVHPCSVSILYKKALIDGEDQLFWDSNRAILDIRDIRWRTFSTATRDACEFAKTKWVQEFNKQHARAHYESDLRNDIYINERLTYYTENIGNKSNASIDAILKLMENRYQGNEHLTDIIKISRDKAVERWNSDANQEPQRVSLYRECLKDIKSKYGYPKIL